MPCWNPSNDKENGLFKTCSPNNGMCSTTTWQYKTTNGMKVTSYWVGIQRGCQPETESRSTGVTWVTHGQGFQHSTNRKADGMTQFVRYYMATDSEIKARENAQYPDAGRTSGTNVGTKPFAFSPGSNEVDSVYEDASAVITVTKTTSSTSPTAISNYKKYGYVTQNFSGEFSNCFTYK